MGTTYTKELAVTGMQMVGMVPTIWQHANFSERWYRDAVREAGGGDGQDSKRREIIFAASFLESYIFEWARTIRIDKVNDYFPPKPRFEGDPRFWRPLTEKWKRVPGELFADNLIPIAPRVKLSPLGSLVRCRNGLIHARASRPVTSGLAKHEKPVPALGELDGIAHGWALGVAKHLVLDLHQQLQTPPPGYL